MLMNRLTSGIPSHKELPSALYIWIYSNIMGANRWTHLVQSQKPVAMATHKQQPHFVLIPFMAQGHLLPMIDIARMLAQRGVIITIFTTPLNANRVKSVVTRAAEAGLQIRVIQLHFPSEEAGLPQGCECFDMLPSMEMGVNFYKAMKLLQPSIEQNIKELKPTPSCIISDINISWTTPLARKFHIPRIVFHGFCSFALLCLHNLRNSDDVDNVTSDSEYFVVPGLPDRIELTKAQLVAAGILKPSIPGWKEIHDQVWNAEEEAYGIVVNTFDELEKEYARKLGKVTQKKVWCIGPVSLCNKDELDKAERGKFASINEHQYCLTWLDSQEPNSVIYACLGSLTRLGTSQMKELGLGLESSNRPFIWVVRETSEEFKKWLIEEKFEERTKGRALLINGWAPQVLILSHPSIGGFLTHCGWNSTLEGISSGVPMITWPLYGEQFINEKLLVNVIKTGVKSGVEAPVIFGQEEKAGVQVNRHDIQTAIERLMDAEEEGQLRRKRAKELGNLARRATEEEGSSQRNLTLLIQDIMEQANPENQFKNRKVDDFSI